jgi:hypothetical protein
MQGLKFQDQLSYLKKTDFLAGTAFIVGKNIDPYNNIIYIYL